MFLGDVAVAAGLALVLALLCLVLLYPLFLRLAWRPYRARAARALQLEGFRRLAADLDLDLDLDLDASSLWEARVPPSRARRRAEACAHA